MYAKYSPFLQELKVVTRKQVDHLEFSTEAVSGIVTMTDDGVLYLGDDDGEGVCTNRVATHTPQAITDCHAHTAGHCGQITIMDLEIVKVNNSIDHPVPSVTI